MRSTVLALALAFGLCSSLKLEEARLKHIYELNLSSKAKVRMVYRMASLRLTILKSLADGVVREEARLVLQNAPLQQGQHTHRAVMGSLVAELRTRSTLHDVHFL